MTERVDIRCPSGPQRLLASLLRRGEQPTYTTDNLIEFACYDCRRLRRKQGEDVKLVLHRYNVLGEHVETIIR